MVAVSEEGRSREMYADWKAAVMVLASCCLGDGDWLPGCDWVWDSRAASCLVSAAAP